MVNKMKIKRICDKYKGRVMNKMKIMSLMMIPSQSIIDPHNRLDTD